jgi:hypothetical protein
MGNAALVDIIGGSRKSLPSSLSDVANVEVEFELPFEQT